MDPDKLRSLSQWLDQRTGRAAPSSFPPNADVPLPSAGVLRSLVESLAARSENTTNQRYAVQLDHSNNCNRMPERSYDSASDYNQSNVGGISRVRTSNITPLREVDPWMITIYERPSYSAPQLPRNDVFVRPPAFPPNISDTYYDLAYQNALRERGLLPSSGRPPSPLPFRVDSRTVGDRSRSRSPHRRRATGRRSQTPPYRQRSPRREKSPTPPRRRERRRSSISPSRRRRSRSPRRVDRYQRPRSRQRSRSPSHRRRSRSPANMSRRRTSQNSSRDKNRIVSSDSRSNASKPEDNRNNKPIDGNLRVPVALNEAIPYPTILQYIKMAISDFRRVWRHHYRDETDWNGYAYNIRCEIRAQLAKMCNFDGGENGKTFALLSPYLDNKMAMKMHTGCQLVKDLKKKRKKRKHRALVGENSVKSYRVEDSYDCHHGFKHNYEPGPHDLANLQAINSILGIRPPQES